MSGEGEVSGPRYRWSGAAGVGVSLALGAGVIWYPVATAAAVSGGFAIIVGLWCGSRLPKFFLATLSILLIGYAFLGRGFAYLGVPPLFVGEMVLAVGFLTAAVNGGMSSALRSPMAWMLMAFAVWGAVRTIPYWGVYGLDALRDGVLWGYGVFALLVASFLLRCRWLSRASERYGRWLPWLLVWIPVGIVIQRLAGDALPRVPGADVELLAMKPGDAAVHLGGAAVFLLLGLHQVSEQPSKAPSALQEGVWWTAWLAGFLIVATGNRGGLLAVLMAVLVVLSARPRSKWGKVVLIGGVLTAVFFALNLEIDLRETSRKVSPQQILLNLQSIAGSDSSESLESTKDWRLNWWNHIVDYTVFGEYFWTGKGFGINLADDDGFQVGTGQSLRSPHNGHLTILARAGVPGLGLWVLLQGAFAVSLLRAYLRARRAGREWWARIDLWILSYWTAFMVNAAFDVFLEGPQGGIWFWSLMGFGLAALEEQRRQQRQYFTGFAPSNSL
jgi:hypothetical protein